MSNDIIGQGFELMLYGMGTVVVFLALLVVVTIGMSRFLGRFFPEAAVTASASATTGKQAATRGEVDEAVVAAISATIHQHRKDRS